MSFVKSRRFAFAAVVTLFLTIVQAYGEVVIQDVLWTREYDEDFGENYFGTCRFVRSPCGPDNAGVCVPSGRCNSEGGWSSGYENCGGGQGECCHFAESCSANRNLIDIKELVTNIQSLHNFSGNLDACSFRFRKDSSICQIRLDFLQYESASADAQGICHVDKLKIRNSATVERDFTTCGNLNGQHMYLTFGSEDTIQVISEIKSKNSFYHIVATKIPCNSRARVPAHCLQYFTKTDDMVKSFDFGGQQQNNQMYTICVKPTSSSTGIQWKPCTNAAVNPFSIIGPPTMPVTSCTTDWIQIKGLDKACETVPNEPSSWKPYEVMVNFDKMEVPPLPPGFTTPLPADNDPAQCDAACMALTTPAYNCFCSDMATLECTCFITAAANPNPPLVDFNNTGFCMEYTQL